MPKVRKTQWKAEVKDLEPDTFREDNDWAYQAYGYPDYFAEYQTCANCGLDLDDHFKPKNKCPFSPTHFQYTVGTK